MKIISFAWTTPALLAGRKSVTRREWSEDYARWFHAGDDVAAYDRNPESTYDAPESDYEAEGFAFMEEHVIRVDGLPPRDFWQAWHLSPEILWVIRFEVVEIVQAAQTAAEPKAETPQLALPMEAT